MDESWFGSGYFRVWAQLKICPQKAHCSNRCYEAAVPYKFILEKF